MIPVPEDMSTSFQVDNQWFTLTYRDFRHLQAQHPKGRDATNRELIKYASDHGWDMEKFGNFIHVRKP